MAAARRETDEQLSAVANSWRIAALSAAARVGKLPPLEQLLNEIVMPGLPADAVLDAGLSQLSERLGGWRPISPEAKAAMDRLHAHG